MPDGENCVPTHGNSSWYDVDPPGYVFDTFCGSAAGLGGDGSQKKFTGRLARFAVFWRTNPMSGASFTQRVYSTAWMSFVWTVTESQLFASFSSNAASTHASLTWSVSGSGGSVGTGSSIPRFWTGGAGVSFTETVSTITAL